MARQASESIGSLAWIRDDGRGATITAGAEPPTPCTIEPPLAEALDGPAPIELTLTVAGQPPAKYAAVPVPGCPGLAVGVRVAAAAAAPDKTVEHLVNQIAHDLRNHAFGIGLRAELGQRRTEPGSDLYSQFAAVLRQVDALKAYLDRLLLFGRRPVLRPAGLDAAAFLRDTVERFRTGLDPAGSPPEMATVGAASQVRVRWDAAIVSAMLWELLDNAARSAPRATTIEVSLAEDGGTVLIGVRDRGPGVSSASLANLEQPMAVRRAGGAGLGLAIASKMAAAHGGRLTIESTPAGTTATIELPREVAAG